MARPAIFLDRDGTINVEKNYLHRIEDWEWIPGAIEAIRLINEKGFLAIVVTNQAGVARGYYSEEEVQALHNHVDELLAIHGAKIDAYYYCPHHSEFGVEKNCPCRKPQPGMLLQAKSTFDLDFSQSYLIGDKASDVEAALAIDVQPVLVLTGYGQTEQYKLGPKILVMKDVLEAVKKIIG